MIRTLIRLLTTPVAILLIGTIIFLPILLAVMTVAQDMLHGKFDEPLEIVERIGVVLIGWGVALEEREALRSIFRTTEPGREEFERGIDSLCHVSGIGLLIFGLFSEIGTAAIRLPNSITPTEGFDPVVLGISTFFIALGGAVLLNNILRLLIAVVTGRVSSAAHH